MALGDNNIVNNLRREYGERIAAISDTKLADEWREFRQSDSDNFLEWLRFGGLID